MNGHSKHGTIVVYEVEKSDSVGDETIEAASGIRQGPEDMSTVFEVRDNNDRREQLVKRLEVYTDSDWASDRTSRKSTSGAVIIGRMHEIACSQPWSGISGVEQL